METIETQVWILVGIGVALLVVIIAAVMVWWPKQRRDRITEMTKKRADTANDRAAMEGERNSYREDEVRGLRQLTIETRKGERFDTQVEALETALGGGELGALDAGPAITPPAI